MERKREEQPEALADAIEDTPPEFVAEDDSGEEEDPRVDPVMLAWGANENKPNDAMIAEWKGLYGEIFLLALDEDEMYVWRPLARHEYKALMQPVQHEHIFMEQVVQKCVIWPMITPEWLMGGKAGTVSTLHGVIMEGSNFLPPEVAMTLVRKL